MKEPTTPKDRGNGQFKIEPATARPARNDGTADSISGIGGLSELIQSIISAGAYLSFGRTGDGGAVIIRVLDGPDKMTAYCHTRQEFLEAIHFLQVRYGIEKDNLLKFVPGSVEMAKNGRKPTD